MKLDELKQAWQDEVKVVEGQPDLSGAIDALERETDKIDRQVKLRDFIEIAIALIMVPFWIWRMNDAVHPMELAGLIDLTLVCLFIPYKLIMAKKVKASKLNSVRSFLVVKKRKIEGQIKLLGSIVNWYLLPIALGLIMLRAGHNMGKVDPVTVDLASLLYFAGGVALCLLVYFLTKREVKTKLQPVLDKLNKRLAQLPQE